MNNLVGISIRNSVIRPIKPNFHPSLTRWYSKNEKDGTEKLDKVDTAKKTEKSEIALNKLNSLLKEMINEPTNKAPPKSLQLAKPTPKRAKIVSADISKKNNDEAKSSVLNTIKEVAETLGGDTKQTESELMKKLLNNNEEDKSASISSLSDIFKGMKIDRTQIQADQQSRSQQVKLILDQAQREKHRRSPEERVRTRTPRMQKSQVLKLDNVNLFGSEPLGIFSNEPKEFSEGVKNATWESLSQRELKLAITHPPSNYFQQMILWTEQGKLWKFPIDNEQGMEEEKDVYFADHIFLDKYVDSWCPPKGPIRHFMELVCVGLSKNPYLSVAAKKEHIEWYRNYFEDKRQLLKEVGASLREVENSKTKQLE